jgi:hypothetical protein
MARFSMLDLGSKPVDELAAALIRRNGPAHGDARNRRRAKTEVVSTFRSVFHARCQRKTKSARVPTTSIVWRLRTTGWEGA